MYSLIKMELYRCIRSKSFWVIVALMCIYSFWQAYSMCEYKDKAIYEINIQQSSIEEQENTVKSEHSEVETRIGMFQLYGTYLHPTFPSNICSIFALLFFGGEISTSFLKNIGSHRRIRKRWFAANTIVIGIGVFCIMLAGYIAAATCSFVKLGYISFTSMQVAFSQELFYYFVWWLVCSVICLGICLFVIFIDHTAVSMALGLFISLKFLPPIIASIERFLGFKVGIISNYLPTNILFQLANVVVGINKEFVNGATVMLALLYLIAILAIGTCKMIKKEIR